MGSFPIQDEYASLVISGEQSSLRGDFDLSIQYFEEAFALAKRMDDVSGQLQALKELGLLFWNIGQIDKSTKSYKEALSLTDESMPEDKEELHNKVDILGILLW